MKDNSSPALDDLALAAAEKIGALRSRVIRRAQGALPYDYIVPSGVYEELWDWDAFFVGLHLISKNKADGITLKNWCLNFLRYTEPDGQTPGGIRPWAGDVTYYSYDTIEKTHLRHIAYSNQVALWARLAPKDRAREMIERYVLNPRKLWSPHGLRSLAADDPLYNNENVIKPYSNWQGPIWPHANWMFMHALIHYGYDDAALAVAERVTRMCLEDLAGNGMMHENCHAETGAPLAAPTFISWNLLVAQMLEEARARVFEPDRTQALWSE